MLKITWSAPSTPQYGSSASVDASVVGGCLQKLYAHSVSNRGTNRHASAGFVVRYGLASKAATNAAAGSDSSCTRSANCASMVDDTVPYVSCSVYR